ncbi:MAG TPA: phosphatase PAP2 family protein [Paraburkholderia sp.]
MWNSLSNVGDAALTLPIAAACAIWLWFSARHMAARWVLLLAAGMALVGATKILYAGCGIEISSIGFRMISGHTTLSTAVWTVVIALVCRCAGRSARTGVIVGLLIGAVTAVARVFDDAHTIAEVIAGWLLGATVAVIFVRAFVRSEVRLFRPRIAAFGLLLIATFAYGHHAPIQGMIDAYSPGVCARLMPDFAHVRDRL